jgi:hypothetical protein
LDRDEKLKESMIKNFFLNRNATIMDGKLVNKTFSKEPSQRMNARWSTRDPALLKSDDPTFQYDRKMTLEKEDHTKYMKTEEQKKAYNDYYDRTIPADKPLVDAYHLEFYHKYREKMAKDHI